MNSMYIATPLYIRYLTHYPSWSYFITITNTFLKKHPKYTLMQWKYLQFFYQKL